MANKDNENHAEQRRQKKNDHCLYEASGQTNQKQTTLQSRTQIKQGHKYRNIAKTARTSMLFCKPKTKHV